MADVSFALSLRQPWATLLVHGLKNVEVRRWHSDRRGRILIHASRRSDDRPEAWALVPAELRRSAQLVGGIIGAGKLTGCVSYRSREAFAADRRRHLNDPDWFQPPLLYGFMFEDLTVLPFRRCPGWVRFFPVHEESAPSGLVRPGARPKHRSH
jgi:hypothetical protein